jgi:hypothetical protein
MALWIFVVVVYLVFKWGDESKNKYWENPKNVKIWLLW